VLGPGLAAPRWPDRRQGEDVHPEAALQAARPAYGQWKQVGSLEVTEGNQADFDHIEDVLREDCQAGGVRQVATTNASPSTRAALVADGILMVDHAAGLLLQRNLRWFSKLVQTRKLVHDGIRSSRG